MFDNDIDGVHDHKTYWSLFKSKGKITKGINGLPTKQKKEIKDMQKETTMQEIEALYRACGAETSRKLRTELNHGALERKLKGKSYENKKERATALLICRDSLHCIL